MSGIEEDPTTGTGSSEPSEEQLRAAYEAEIKKIRVEHVLLEDVSTLVNLGMRRTGLVAGTEDERDLDQVRVAIESVRSLLPVLEQTAPNQIRQIRDALSQLQLAFVRIGGQAEPSGGTSGSGEEPAGEGAEKGPGPAAPGTEEPGSPKPGEPGPAQRSGRLWVPGQ